MAAGTAPAKQQARLAALLVLPPEYSCCNQIPPGLAPGGTGQEEEEIGDCDMFEAGLVVVVAALAEGAGPIHFSEIVAARFESSNTPCRV